MLFKGRNKKKLKKKTLQKDTTREATRFLEEKSAPFPLVILHFDKYSIESIEK